MSNQFGFVSEETYAEKMDTQNQFLAGILNEMGGSLRPSSWGNTQALVRAGLIDRMVGIADQFTMERSSTNIVWDVIGKNHDTPTDPQYDKTLTLQTHDCIAEMQFDAPEAFYYCASELPAGTYYFVIDSTYDATYNDLSAYQFTLTQAVPAKGQLTFPWGVNVNASTVKVNSFSSATSTTPIEQVAVTEGTDGTNLGTLTIAGDFSNNLNSIHRVRYGSNNYKESAIRQWLNSSAAAGSVWSPKTKWDRPPSWAANTAGFMNAMDADFLAVIGKTHIVAARNTVCEGGGYDEMDDYFFLLSRENVYMGREVSGVNEGAVYPYYRDYSDLSAAGTDNDSNRIKYRNGSAKYWWVRTPLSGSAYLVRGVGLTGTLNSPHADGSIGVAPACNII